MLIPVAIVIAGLKKVQDELDTIKPDGSVSINTDDMIATDVGVFINGPVSQLLFVFENGPESNESGGCRMSELNFIVLDSVGTATATQTILPASNTSYETYSIDAHFPDAGVYTVRITEVGNDNAVGALLGNPSSLQSEVATRSQALMAKIRSLVALAAM